MRGGLQESGGSCGSNSHTPLLQTGIRQGLQVNLQPMDLGFLLALQLLSA